MSEARLERIERDPYLAKSFLLRARRFAADAKRRELAAETRQVVLHSATIAACDAALAIEGFEVVGIEGGHKLRIETALDLLPDVPDDMFDRLDDARLSRNQVSYAAGFSTSEDLDAAEAAVTALIALVEESVGSRLPDWLTEP
jgi:hypothetical protein